MDFILEIVHLVSLHLNLAHDLFALFLLFFKLILLTCIPLFKVNFLLIFGL